MPPYRDREQQRSLELVVGFFSLPAPTRCAIAIWAPMPSATDHRMELMVTKLSRRCAPRARERLGNHEHIETTCAT